MRILLKKAILFGSLLVFSPINMAGDVRGFTVEPSNTTPSQQQSGNLAEMNTMVNQLAPQVMMNLQQFLLGINQLSTPGLTSQQGITLLQQLIPIAAQLSNNLNQLSYLVSDINKSNPQGQPLAAVMQKVAVNNASGAQVFSTWHGLLQGLLNALTTNDIASFQVILQKMPLASQQFVAFVQRVGTLQNEVNAIQQQATTNQSQTPATAQQNMELYRIMGEMNQMQHNTTMGIINNMGPTCDYTAGNTCYHQ
jgi:hypothetical protein